MRTIDADPGLDALTKTEIDEIAAPNAAHKQTFGFPFTITVRMYTKAQNISEFRCRVASDTQAEYEEDLGNDHATARPSKL